MDLTERKKRILRAIIESYIQSAEPVGSKAIASSIGMEVSSATIRNEMADLEAMGLLEKPHTSAGRIPSPKGYRLYVNELMEEHKLSLQETERMNQALRLQMQELDRVLDQAGRVVSRLTNYPAFALSSGMDKVTIRRFDLLMVEHNAFIIVVMTDTNVVRNRLIRLPSDLTEAQLQMLNTLLNTTFTGLTLAEIAPELMRVAQHAAGEADGADAEGPLPARLKASGDFDTASALSLLVFILLYFPCIATIAAIGAEAGWKWAVGAVVYNTALAWGMAWLTYHIVQLF